MTQAPTSQPVVTGLFSDRDGAERAYRDALELGYAPEDINVILSDETRRRYFGDSSSALDEKVAEDAQKPAKGEDLGGPVGGTIGMIAPALAAVGTLLLIPGLVIVGPVAVALAAAGAVGLAGGLVGALTDWGIPKERLHQYEDHVRRGGILIGVKPRSEDDSRQLEQAWNAHHGDVARR